ncbi:MULTISPECIES: hypothetical protein [Thalassolituus]|jgi:hypothetical protein|uniref:hypothetical protein n=1 Tax=Thalassolituus TaxID=187492 RepID=UPI001173CF70|nr:MULTISPECIES: hypothetical protein [Thalassolituus]TPD48937.1 MAG: hypothetical protein C9355_16110 [Thalassolituus maritimus]|tara:strand:- start:511 stop:1191 length:681 start_codon:yes stop_codon:yes gene_type:complete
MRWIVYSLIVINLGIAGYFITRPTEDSIARTQDGNLGQGKTLVLLSEKQSGNLPVSQQPVRPDPGKKLCYALGPYLDDLSARVAQARSLELGLTGLISQHKVPNLKDAEFWVHVRPLPSRGEAMTLLRKLQARSVDSYIITQGDLADGISLGLFRQKSSADALQKKVTGLGFEDVAIREVGSTTTEFWVEIREISKLDETMRRRVKAEDQDVQWQMVSCRHQPADG